MSEDISMQQLVTFPLADYLFALPGQHVVKVVAMPSANEGGLMGMGFVQLGPYSIKLLDLPTMLDLSHKKKAGSAVETDSEETNPPFLLVLQTQSKDLLGIPLDTPPDLLEWPQDKLQSVPHSQRKTGTFQWVSHVAPCDSRSHRKVLLLLDLSALLSPNPVGPNYVADIIVDPTGVLSIEPPLDPPPFIQVASPASLITALGA